MEEIWKDIEGCDLSQQVSNMGRLRILNYKGLENYIRELSLNKYGYPFVCIRIKGKKKILTVHRIVANTFIPNIDNKFEVNHINGVKTDNRVENLEWCTHKENMIHSFKVLGNKNTYQIKNPNKGKFGNKSHLAKSILQYDLKGNLIKEWGSIITASIELKIQPTGISMCCNGKLKTSGGYVWEMNTYKI